MPVAPGPVRAYPAISPAKSRVATIAANAAEPRPPATTASKPRRFSIAASRSAAASRDTAPTRKISAAATPSGYGKSLCATSARRNGTVYMTPRIPPSAQTPNDSQYGNPVHQPTMTRPGSTKMMDESVPAADATVWTMLFS